MAALELDNIFIASDLGVDKAKLRPHYRVLLDSKYQNIGVGEEEIAVVAALQDAGGDEALKAAAQIGHTLHRAGIQRDITRHSEPKDGEPTSAEVYAAARAGNEASFRKLLDQHEIASPLADHGRILDAFGEYVRTLRQVAVWNGLASEYIN